MPTVLIIAGPNGAGKTTFANAVLSRRLGQAGDEARDLEAGWRMLRLLDDLTAEGRDIALETTLATLSPAHGIERASLPPRWRKGRGWWCDR